MGQRLESLDALTKAARLHRDQRLRDEAIAALALADVRTGPSWNALPQGYRSLGFDNDYLRYVRANDEGIISVRTIPDDRELQVIHTEPTKTEWLVFSPDGEYFTRLENGQILRLWRVADGAELIREPPTQVTAAEFSPDSQQLVISQGGWLLRFDVTTGTELNRWKLAEESTAWGLAFHPDNRRLAVGYSASSHVSIFDASTGELLNQIPVGASQYQTVAWHPHGSRLAVGQEKFIQIWDVDAERKFATLSGHVQQVQRLTFHPEGALLASDSWDGTLRLWDTSTGRQVMQLAGTVFLRFSRDGRWLGAASNGANAQLLEVTPTIEYRTLASNLGVEEAGYEGDISSDGRLLAMDMDRGVHLWDLPSGRQVAMLPKGKPLFLPEGSEVLISNEAGLHRHPIRRDPMPDRFASGIDFGGNPTIGPSRTIQLPFVPTRFARIREGQTLGMVSESAGVGWLVDLESETVRPERMEHEGAGYVGLSPDVQWMSTSGWHSGVVRLWNARTGSMIREWPLFRATSFFTPDSRVLVISQGDEFGFYDVASGKLLYRIRRDVSLYPGHVAFAPQGGLMALEMDPGVIHLKDIATGQTVARLEDPHGDRATWMGFTPDGGQLVVNAVYSKAIHVWDLRAIRRRLKLMNLDWDKPEIPANP
jgi:WD40 repeat protein